MSYAKHTEKFSTEAVKQVTEYLSAYQIRRSRRAKVPIYIVYE